VSHFAAIGIPTADAAEVQEVLARAFDRAGDAGEVAEHESGLTARYVDPSGATLSIHTSRTRRFECCQPGFDGGSRFSWQPTGVVADGDGCGFCDLVYAELLDEDGEAYYPFTLTLENMGEARGRLGLGEHGEVTFAALCEEGEVWPDEASFERAQEAEWQTDDLPPDVPQVKGFAAQSLIPTGTFGDAMTSHVLAHGVVRAVERRRNELAGGDFLVVRLDTLGGTFDVCAEPGALDCEELLAPGAVARATLWLVGRPLTLRAAPERKVAGLLRRFR